MRLGAPAIRLDRDDLRRLNKTVTPGRPLDRMLDAFG